MDFAALAAVIAALGAVLKLTLDALADQRRGFEKFLGNHMSSNTRALQQMARSVEILTDRLERQEAEKRQEPDYRKK